jgi:hypothetical protein
MYKKLCCVEKDDQAMQLSANKKSIHGGKKGATRQKNYPKECNRKKSRGGGVECTHLPPPQVDC